MKQPQGEMKDAGVGSEEADSLLIRGENENWWPGMRRWNIGLYCPDATLDLGEPEVL